MANQQFAEKLVAESAISAAKQIAEKLVARAAATLSG